MANDLIDSNAVAKEFGSQVTERMADWFEAELKTKAVGASRRARIIRSHGHTYSYAKYSNTGQLARNIKQVKQGDKIIVDAGTRANYSSGYHGMYFLRTKKGMSEVKSTLKKGTKYAESLKL